MNIICGAIATGKTAILKYIDYCLGRDSLPQDPEFKKVEVLFLEARIDGERSCTVERKTDMKADIVVYNGGFTEIGKKAKQTFKAIGFDYFTDSAGLKGVKVKKNVALQESGLEQITFRTLFKWCYLDEERIDTKKNLLFESGYDGPRFRKAFDVLFKIVDASTAEKQEEIKALLEQRRDVETSKKNIQKFMQDFGIPSLDIVKQEKDTLEAEKARKLADHKRLVDEQVQSTDVCKDLRDELTRIEKERAAADTRLRDKEIARARLGLLLGQHEEDARRIKGIIQAKELFDPIGISRCPACLEAVSKVGTETDAACFLCGKERSRPAGPASFPPLTTEKHRLEEKVRDLQGVLGGMDKDIAMLKREIKERDTTHEARSKDLQARTALIVAPTLEAREHVYGEIKDLERKIAEKDQHAAYHDSIAQKDDQISRIDARKKALDAEIKTRPAALVTRTSLVTEFSALFHATLKAIQYEKIDDGGRTFIDDSLVPHVRGEKYEAVGSKGNATMINQAYYIAFFKLLKRHENIHPRFFMIDSPGNAIGWSGLTQDVAIVDAIYDEFASLLDEGTLDQIIIVDNRPPDKYQSRIIARFSRNKDKPPYGFIDDETGASSLPDSIKDAILRALSKNKITNKTSAGLKKAIGMDVEYELILVAIKDLIKEKKIKQDEDKNIVLA
jgi:hypothetical protein